MTPTLAITYDLVGIGWSTCVIEVEGQRVELSASYLSDALGNLVLFAHAVVSGFHSASFGFDEEPGEYRWLAEATAVGIVRLRVLEFDELWGHRPSSEGKVLLEIELRRLTLAEAVAAAANAVLQKYGPKGYVEKWLDYPFPKRELALLRSSIAQWRR